MSKKDAVIELPTIREIESTAANIAKYLMRTPTARLLSRSAEGLGDDAEIQLKLELFQRTGTFKARGALSKILGLSEEEKKRGVVAASAGNHAVAVSYASKIAGISAKVVMAKTASPVRIALSKSFGAEVILVADIHEAFSLVKDIEARESRVFVHPYNDPAIVLGTATLGLELLEQLPDIESVIVPVGGGGLIAGIAAAVKQKKPDCQIYGVEPEGADSMSRSFVSGRPERMEKVATIADSLGAPFAEDYTYNICRECVDEMVTVSDEELKVALYLLFKEAKLAVEPAGAAATAALFGPLKRYAENRKTAVIVCGANIDHLTYSKYLAEGEKGYRQLKK